MLDINTIRENPEIVRQDLEKRKEKEKLEWLEDLREEDEKWRNLKYEVDGLRQERNELSEKINKLMKAGKKDEAQDIIKKAKKVLPKIEGLEEEMEELKEKIDYYLLRLPNILHDSVPYGKDDSENEEIRKWGDAESPDWLKTHSEVAEALGGADFERSAKVAGHGFYYLYGDLAMLNQALIRFSIDYMREQGFEYSEPPLMMRKEYYKGVTDMEAFDDVLYKAEDEDLYMIATSEHPLMAQFADEVVPRKVLPVNQCAYSMCFRKEVGTRSVDEKGLFRTHQFNKVEMIVIAKPDESWDWHEKMINYSEEIYKKLEIPYRIVNVCTGDMGIVASKKYDIEAWFPRQNAYREVGSCSNCTDYQARRLNIKYETEDGGHGYVHTLNNTAIATSRALVAILENYQNKDGSVTVPEVLRSYMGGKEKLTPNN